MVAIHYSEVSLAMPDVTIMGMSPVLDGPFSRMVGGSRVAQRMTESELQQQQVFERAISAKEVEELVSQQQSGQQDKSQNQQLEHQQRAANPQNIGMVVTRIDDKTDKDNPTLKVDRSRSGSAVAPARAQQMKQSVENGEATKHHSWRRMFSGSRRSTRSKDFGFVAALSSERSGGRSNGVEEMVAALVRDRSPKKVSSFAEMAAHSREGQHSLALAN